MGIQYLSDKQIQQMKADFEKSVLIAGFDLTYKKFEDSNEADPLYDGERKEKELVYRIVKIKALVNLNPRAWVIDDLGNRKDIDAQFTIAAKSFEDLQLDAVDARDRIEFNGEEYVIIQIKQGPLPLGQVLSYALSCKTGIGI